MTTRTAAQGEASRMNGARSAGPITLAGKQVSSLNAVKGGFGSEALLLPHESVERYGMVVRAWVETLRPASPAEGKLVARVADLDWRLERLARMEHKAVLSEADRLVQESAPAKELAAHRNVKQIISAMARMAEESKLSAQAEGALDGVLKAIKIVVDQLVALGVAGPEVTLLLGKVRELAVADLVGDVDAVWKSVGRLAREIEAGLSKKMTALEEALEVERKSLLEDLALGDEAHLRRLRRHRASLQRELDGTLATMQKVRELAAVSGDQLPDRPCVAIELRMITVGSSSK